MDSKKTGLYALGGVLALGSVLLLKNKLPGPPPPGGDVTVNFTSNPSGATVYINNYPIGQTAVSYDFAIGEYLVKFSLPGYEDYTAQMVIDGNYDTLNLNAILTPVEPPATPSLTLMLDSVSRYAPPATPAWNYPHILARAANYENSQIGGRGVIIFRKYISTSSGLPIITSSSLADPLIVDNIQVGNAYPSFTLSPGQVTGIDYYAPIDLPTDRVCDVWLQDAVTGAKSIV